MTLIQFRNHFRELLAPLYSSQEIDDLFKRCIQHYFQWNSLKIGLEPQYELAREEAQQLHDALEQLNTATPLQYVLGEANFMGLNLVVNKGVLIPRPETEELVEWVLANHEEKSLKCWDLCSGSGSIALGLKVQRENWVIGGYELSEPALEVARNNAKRNSLDVSFYAQDILQWKAGDEQVDLIVSNPPYVLPSEKAQMHANVLKHEPGMALFVPQEDPLLFYRRILCLAITTLASNGALYFEINPLLVKEMIALGKASGFEVATVKKDIFGKDRFIQFSTHEG